MVQEAAAVHDEEQCGARDATACTQQRVARWRTVVGGAGSWCSLVWLGNRGSSPFGLLTIIINVSPDFDKKAQTKFEKDGMKQVGLEGTLN